MDIQTKQQAIGRIVQNGEFCFELGEHCIDCKEQDPCLAIGYIHQLAFGNDFLIEDMAWSFLSDANVEYQTRHPFIEILCLDSVSAWDCGQGNDAKAVLSGIHIHFHQAQRGVLRFSAGTPIKGIRIVLKNQFCRDCLTRKFPRETWDFLLEDRLRDRCLQDPKLQMVFSQIKDSLRAGVALPAYYESKIIELLCLVSELNSAASGRQRLSDADMAAVKKAQSILREHFSDAPAINRLAVMTGTSPAKLQRDFKTVFGCTIHSYLQTTRMTKALQLIENTEVPLYLIAREVGCKNPGHFSEIFRQTYGVSPHIYRRNLHGKALGCEGRLS